MEGLQILKDKPRSVKPCENLLKYAKSCQIFMYLRQILYWHSHINKSKSIQGFVNYTGSYVV